MEKNEFGWKKEDLEKDLPIFKKNLREYKKMVKIHEEEFNNSLLKNFDVLKLKIKSTKKSLSFNVEQLPQDLKDKYDFLNFEKSEIKRKTALVKELDEKLKKFKSTEEKQNVANQLTQTQPQKKDDLDIKTLTEIYNVYFNKPQEDLNDIIKKRVKKAKRSLKKQAKKEKQP